MTYKQFTQQDLNAAVRMALVAAGVAVTPADSPADPVDTCTVDGCTSPRATRSNKHNMCSAHYETVALVNHRRARGLRTDCDMTGCPEPCSHRYYCQAHYNAGKRRVAAGLCFDLGDGDTVAACTAEPVMGDYCHVHYRKAHHTAKTCVERGCTLPVSAAGLCPEHVKTNILERFFWVGALDPEW